MNLFEITYPAGALDAEERQALAGGLLAGYLVEPDAPREAVERAGRMTHVWFHEADTWVTGGSNPTDARRSEPSGRPRQPVVVTVTVPEAWRAELAPHAIGAVRSALARHAPHIALHEEGAVWVNVVGVAEGSIGMDARPARSADIVRGLTRDVEIPDAAPDGGAVDPVCGMTVRVGPRTSVLVHDGRTVAFCGEGCRAVYAEDHRIALPA
jgi:hypothetical protein